MWLDVFKAVIPSLIAGGFTAWLFASSDTAQLAWKRLKTLGGFLYRSFAVLGGLGILSNATYQFYKFGSSEDPIARIEVIELFFQALNILVYLPVTMFVVAFWINQRKKQA
ncbi:putative Inner membrane protein [Pseudomonas donghuensis]|uniref:hypothetical protein n=1 Tax=Pseudomonas donghuensis TaxID=1163398 RepID=UPI0039E04FF7